MDGLKGTLLSGLDYRLVTSGRLLLLARNTAGDEDGCPVRHIDDLSVGIQLPDSFQTNVFRAGTESFVGGKDFVCLGISLRFGYFSFNLGLLPLVALRFRLLQR